MRPLSDVQKTTSFRFTSDMSETVGDESLISDARSRVKSTEMVERKLQMALQCNRIPGCSMESPNAS